MGYSDLVQPFNIFGSSPSPASTPTSTAVVPAPAPAPAAAPADRAALPGEQVYDFANGKATLQAPKTPNPAPNPVPTYSFLDGSKYSGGGKQLKAPTVVTAKPAVQDLQNKQAALGQAVQAQSQQQQTIQQNQAQAQATPPQTSQPTATQPTPTTTTPSTADNGSSAANAANSAIAAVQRQSDAAFQQLQNQLTQIQNGTFPLTPSQQAQVTATQNSFNQLKNAQQLANANYEGQVALAGAIEGINQTAPQINAQQIYGAVSEGVDKIAGIDSQASKAVADLQQGFMTQDYNMINAAYSAASKLFADKTQAIQDMNTNVRNATQDALAQHRQDMADAQQQLDNQRSAVQFAATNGITMPFYLVGNTAIDTKTGLPVTLQQYQAATGQQVGLPEDQTDFSKIQHVADPAVMALRSKYGDAGILPTDTPEQAAAKLKHSAIYYKETYIAPTAGGSVGGAYIAGANPAVDSWVKLIGSNPTAYKIANVPKALQNQVAQGLAATSGNATDLLSLTQQSLKDLNDMVTKDQGFSGAVGSKFAFGTLGGLAQGGLPGSSEANFNAKLNQVKNDVIIPNLTLLHGLGRVTDREFQALSSAITSLSPSLSEDEFKSELQKVTDGINAKIAQPSTDSSAQVPAGNVLVVSPDGQQGYIPQAQLQDALNSGYKQP